MAGNRGEVNLVKVEGEPVGLQAWVPYMDYADLVSENTWDDAMWMGPVKVPKEPSL
jgi:hypothetical protein